MQRLQLMGSDWGLLTQWHTQYKVCVCVYVYVYVYVYVCVCVCVCARVRALPNVLPILFHELPSGPRRGSLLRLQVYLKLCLVYLMNGCLSKEQGGSVQRASRTLMCVFKGENGEVVITVSTDTVIRKFLLPWQMRYKSTSADPPLVQQPVDT